MSSPKPQEIWVDSKGREACIDEVSLGDVRYHFWQNMASRPVVCGIHRFIQRFTFKGTIYDTRTIEFHELKQMAKEGKL